MKKVYLAGPISGLNYDDAQSWRDEFARAMPPAITCYSPLRCKGYLRSEGVLDGSYQRDALSASRGIMTRDHWDCKTADLILVNLLGATHRVSIGTVMEIAWGHAYRKPVVLMIERDRNVHDHPMVQEATGFRVACMSAAIRVVQAILLPNNSANETGDAA